MEAGIKNENQDGGISLTANKSAILVRLFLMINFGRKKK